MASEISHRHTATGATLYATIRNTARQMWNTAGTPAFEALTVANWGDYDIALAESPASSYFYVGDFPAAIADGWYWVDIYSGATAISDTLVVSYFGYWDGTTFKWWADDTTQVAGTAQTPGDLAALLTDIDSEVDQIAAVIGSIAVTGAALTKEAASTVNTGGGSETGAYTDTQVDNGTRHTTAATAGGLIDRTYRFTLPTTAVGAEVLVDAYLQEAAAAGGDSVALRAWDWTASGGAGAWEVIHADMLTGVLAVDAVDIPHRVGLLARHTGTGANAGKVDINFYTDSAEGVTTILAVDKIVVQYAESLGAVLDAQGLTAVRAAYLDNINAPVAKTGEDGDTLKTLSDQIDNAAYYASQAEAAANGAKGSADAIKMALAALSCNGWDFTVPGSVQIAFSGALTANSYIIGYAKGSSTIQLFTLDSTGLTLDYAGTVPFQHGLSIEWCADGSNIPAGTLTITLPRTPGGSATPITVKIPAMLDGDCQEFPVDAFGNIYDTSSGAIEVLTLGEDAATIAGAVRDELAIDGVKMGNYAHGGAAATLTLAASPTVGGSTLATATALAAQTAEIRRQGAMTRLAANGIDWPNTTITPDFTLTANSYVLCKVTYNGTGATLDLFTIDASGVTKHANWYTGDSEDPGYFELEVCGDGSDIPAGNIALAVAGINAGETFNIRVPFMPSPYCLEFLVGGDGYPMGKDGGGRMRQDQGTEAAAAGGGGGTSTPSGAGAFFTTRD